MQYCFNHLNTKGLTPFRNVRAIVKSKSERNRKIQNSKRNMSFRNARRLAKLSGLPKIKLKIAIQVPKTHIYTLFRVLSTTTTASEK